MDNSIRNFTWAGIFLTASTINLSRFCVHTRQGTDNMFNRYANFQGNSTAAEAGFISPVESLRQHVPQRVTWENLRDLTFKKKFSEKYKLDLMYPVFGNSLTVLNGKTVYIKGYMIPMEFDNSLYAISQNPYDACFFCGGSGPESVMQLKFKKKARYYETDEYMTLKGKLVLNDSEENDFIYILEDAEEYR